MDDTITIEECIARLDAIRHEVVPNSRDHFALSAGIAALYEMEKGAPAVNRWIPVEDALPEIDRDVLVYYPYWKDNPIQVAHLQYDGILFELSDGEFNLPVKAVTHWMYLPESPEKE